MTIRRLLAVVSLAIATTTPALADANSDVSNAMIAFTKLTSYHMDITTAHGATIHADFASPGRYHTISAGTESIVVGQTMYLKLGGSWRKMAGNLGAMPDYTSSLTSHHSGYVATDLGPRMVAGAALHAYKVTDSKTHKSDTIFLDGSGRLVRIEAGGTTVIVLSKLNAPITIRAPI